MPETPCPQEHRPGESLEELSREELQQVMHDRLHGFTSLGPPLGGHAPELPYKWLVEQFQHGSPGLRAQMSEIAASFLGAIVDPAAWPWEPRGNLLDFLVECDKAPPILDQLIDEGALLSDTDEGRMAHASLLKCSMALGHRKRYPGFWLEQLKWLGNDFGALIFTALLDHGLELAFGNLHHCVRSHLAVKYIGDMFPGLVDKWGMGKVAREFLRVRRHLPIRIAIELESKLQVLGADFSLTRRLRGIFEALVPNFPPIPKIGFPELRESPAPLPASRFTARRSRTWGDLDDLDALLNNQPVRNALEKSTNLRDHCPDEYRRLFPAQSGHER
jgi:hypothetical protein